MLACCTLTTSNIVNFDQEIIALNNGTKYTGYVISMCMIVHVHVCTFVYVSEGIGLCTNNSLGALY